MREALGVQHLLLKNVLEQLVLVLAWEVRTVSGGGGDAGGGGGRDAGEGHVPSKGGLPTIISYMRTPRAQKSTDLP